MDGPERRRSVGDPGRDALINGITGIMSGTNAIPRLVVKIIGGKQVKQFIEEPQEDTSKTEDPLVEATFDDFETQGVTASARQVQDRVDSALWAAINQVPDRVCVTAPSGDRSRSYIHPKSHIADPGAAGAAETTEQTGVCEDGDKAELSSAVSVQLSDWQLSSLTSAEDEVAALDSSSRGTIHRSQITQLFLKNDVPLKLPTFSLLLQIFSDESDPDQCVLTGSLQKTPTVHKMFCISRGTSTVTETQGFSFRAAEQGRNQKQLIHEYDRIMNLSTMRINKPEPNILWPQL
ncbi:hypothetical protein PAMP_024004 [Pampus punctatissimus]